MLRQSARRRALQKCVQQSSQRLYLPWLCPAVFEPRLRTVRSSQTLTTPSSTPRSSSPSARLSRNPPARDLASVASEPFTYPADDQYVPFSASDPFATNPFTPPLYDASAFLGLENPIPQDIARVTRTKYSVSGDVSQIQATFQACLHVGRFERAEGLLTRLATVCSINSEEFKASNDQFLRYVLRAVVRDRKQEDYKQLTNWIRRVLPKFGVSHDAVAHAALIRGSIATMDGDEQKKYVRKYWKEIEEKEIETDVLGTGLLTDEDARVLTEYCHDAMQRLTENHAPGEDSQSDHSTELDSDITVNLSDEIATAPAVSSSPVRAVDQVGLGLKYLKESMIPLNTPSFGGHRKWSGAGQEETERILAHRQEQLETQSIDAALRQWREERASGGHSDNPQRMRSYLSDWQTKMTKKIEAELRLVDEAEKKTKRDADDQAKLEYGPFLRLVKPERLAGLTIITFLSTLGKPDSNFELKLSHVMVRIGKAVHMEALLSSVSHHATESVEGDKSAKNLSRFIESTLKAEGERALWKIHKRLSHENLTTETGNPLSKSAWSNLTYARVGSILVQHMMNLARVRVEATDPETKEQLVAYQPAFERIMKFELGKKTAYLRLHESVQNRLRQDPSPNFLVKHLPMLCPPKPWKGFLDGGYFKTVAPLLRVKNNVDRQRRYVEVAASRGDLDSFFSGLDILGRTGWRINQDVYKVMLEAWNSGDPIANLAPAEFNEPPPTRPEDPDPAKRGLWRSQMMQWENRKIGLHSERCFQNLQMEMAQNFLHEKFYLPHNADFRGRAYPMPPYLNQMGADNVRGLLLFGEGKALGNEGLRWLKIHLANVFGFDKASLYERELFAMQHLEDIRDSVKNPLDGQRWWLQAEDPWQCLATCFELHQALNSPDPTHYVSCLPVHQDGSCNGLQHYAALGGDKAGAQQVNLEPSDRPSDVYTGVAELVKAEVAKDAAAGLKVAQLMDGKVKRKIVKQTVMTNVYGVTFLGAMRQVKKQLESHYPELKQGRVKASGICASYIARKIFDALGSIFNGAHNIQFWLGDCASRISASLTPEQAEIICSKTESKDSKDSKLIQSLKKSPEKHFTSSVTWTTPLNLTVVQPYRHFKTTNIATSLQTVAIKDPSENDAINKRRQLQAFPPNFVHSLDATHMILSALRCEGAGLTFSAVHDSFWTHAADIPVMGRLLRDAFVQMHSEDIVGRLATEFKLRYSRHIFRAAIQLKPNPLRKEVEKWRREFMKTHNIPRKSDLSVAELKLEVKRQGLLRSEDPSDRAEGRAMRTPAAIFEELDGEQYLTTQKSLGQIATGEIPETLPEDIIESALDPEPTDPLIAIDMVKSIAPEVDEDDETFPFVAGRGSVQEPVPEEDLGLESSSEAPKLEDAREKIIQGLGIATGEELTPAQKLIVETIEESKAAAEKKEKLKSSVSAKHYPSMYIWLPLRFAEVPKRGAWDVTKIKQSDYFFS